jgi:hypothetical protein
MKGLACAARVRAGLGALFALGLTFEARLTEAQAAVVAGDELRDVHGPVFAPAPWWQGLMLPGSIALGALVVLLGVVAARALLRRPKSAAELALGRIDRAEAGARILGARAFAAEVSEAVRAFLEARYQVHAPRRTTEELLAQLASDAESPLAQHAASLSELLSCADLVKFSGASLSPDSAARLARLAREFVMAAAEPVSEPRVIASAPGGAPC